MSTQDAIRALKTRHHFAIMQAVRAPERANRLGTRAFWIHRAHLSRLAIDRLRYPYATRAAA